MRPRKPARHQQHRIRIRVIQPAHRSDHRAQANDPQLDWRANMHHDKLTPFSAAIAAATTVARCDAGDPLDATSTRNPTPGDASPGRSNGPTGAGAEGASAINRYARTSTQV